MLGSGDIRDGVVQDEHQLRRRDDDQGQAERTNLACLQGSRSRHL
jgi:hypothetical protein